MEYKDLVKFLLWLINLFRKAPQPKPVEVPPATLTLPHPEEPPTNTPDGNGAFTAWLFSWDVPEKYFDYWNQIKIYLTENLVNPHGAAEMDSENNVLRIRPAYCTPGVIAHECAHESWSLLSDAAKKAFVVDCGTCLNDPLIQLLVSIKQACMYNADETHSELYRYLGASMPEILKQYYPKLF